MADAAALDDWELLAAATAAADKPSPPSTADSYDGAIKHDYFSLDRPPSEPDADDDAGVDSDNPSWLEPDSHAHYPRPRLALSDASWSDDSPPASEKGDGDGDSVAEAALTPLGDSAAVVGRDGGGEGEGKRTATAWWKMPFEVLKLYVLRARPLWPISVAAAFVGIAVLGRRLYRMRQRGRSVPLRIAGDDKKVSQFVVRAIRPNDAFSVARRVPVIRPALSAVGGVTPWSLVS